MTIDDLFKRIVRARLPLLACFVLVPLLGVLLLGSRQHPVWVANARVQVFDGAPSSTTEADGSSSRVLALATTPGLVRTRSPTRTSRATRPTWPSTTSRPSASASPRSWSSR